MKLSHALLIFIFAIGAWTAITLDAGAKKSSAESVVVENVDNVNDGLRQAPSSNGQRSSNALRQDESPPWRAVGRYTHMPIRESSGIVKSGQFEDVYWTLNDSGNPATLYATKRTGELIGEVAVKGAGNIDWEALGIDDKNQLWIGEIGNNSRLRIDLKVVVVREPNPLTETEVEVMASYPYRYPAENVDAEGLFIADGVPYIVSKERERAVLYRFPSLQADKRQVLERVGEFAGAKWVTGAGLSADGRRLAVCTYDRLWAYHGAADNTFAQLIQSDAWVLPHNFGGEAVCFEGYDLVLTNEARDIYALPQLWYEAGWKLPPNDTVPVTVDGGGLSEGLGVERYREAGIAIDGQHVVLKSASTDGLTFSVEAGHKNVYEIGTILTRGRDYGMVELAVNGVVVGEPYDCYHDTGIAGTFVMFGTAVLHAGTNQVTLRSVGKRVEARGDKIGIDSYRLRHASPFVRRYLVLGPFPKADVNSIAEPLPPESEVGALGDVKSGRAYQGIDDKTVRWQGAEAEADGMLALLKHIGNEPLAVGYALCYVYAPKDMEAVLLLGSDDQVAVWLNGAEIHRLDANRPAIPDEDAVPCQLKAGWNEVLCKIGQNGWGWGLYLRWTDAEGVLKYGTAPE